jgi:MFS-type transporter involved in bile tolerance (Atg22 family)
MSETNTAVRFGDPGGRRVPRRIGAVLAGLAAIFVLSLGTDAVMHAAGVFPPWGKLGMTDSLFVLATVYRGVFAVIGCAVTARLAPDRPILHALVLGAVGTVLTSVGAITTWNAGPEFGPHWYPLALIATSMPLAWAGGKLESTRSRRINPNHRGEPR